MVLPGLVGGFGKQKYSLFLNNFFIKIKAYHINKFRLNNVENLNLNLTSEMDTNINLLRSQIGPYLAGLIEGDGTFATHETSSNINKYNPKIIIVFKRNDLTLAYYLQQLTKCGTVLNKPDRGYVLWQIQDIVSIFTIISIINGFMRTPKIEALNRTIV